MTNVGYADIRPTTVLGKTVASAVMILGYAIIAVPTGIVSAEIAQLTRSVNISTQSCPACGADDHDPDAKYCKRCGEPLHAVA